MAGMGLKPAERAAAHMWALSERELALQAELA